MDGQDDKYNMHDECGCPSSGQEEHDKMRKGEVDIGGKETSTKKLMSHQTGEDLEM